MNYFEQNENNFDQRAEFLTSSNNHSNKGKNVAHTRKVKPGELFTLPDGTAIRNNSDRTISLSKLSVQEVQELQIQLKGKQNEDRTEN